MSFSLKGIGIDLPASFKTYKTRSVDDSCILRRIDSKKLTMLQEDLQYCSYLDAKSLSNDYGKDRLFGKVKTYAKTAAWYGSMVLTVAAIAAIIMMPPAAGASKVAVIAFKVFSIAVVCFAELVVLLMLKQPPAGIVMGGAPGLEKTTTFALRLQEAKSKEAVAELLLNYNSDFYEGADRFVRRRFERGTGGIIGDLWRYGMADQELLEKVFVARTMLHKLFEQCAIREELISTNTNDFGLLTEYTTQEALVDYQKRTYYQIKGLIAASIPEDAGERKKLFPVWGEAKKWTHPDFYSKYHPSGLTETPGTLHFEKEPMS